MNNSFSRRIDVTARDSNGELVRGADFEWFVGCESVGSGHQSDGHSCLEVSDPNASVAVSAILDGERKPAVTLAHDQNFYEFVFDVAIHPTWKDFAMKHFPALIGIFFILLAVVLAFVFQEPNTLQTRILLATFALGGGGFGGEIAGFINTDLTLGEKLKISAGGACAIFVILFFFVPAGA